MAEAIISLKDVNFTYNAGKDNEYHALLDISVDIYPEEFVIIFGPSGCGKSTFLNVLAGLEVPDSGSVFVLGNNIVTMTRDQFAKYHRGQVGMVFQAYNLITSLSVLDNVALPQIFINTSKRQRDEKARALLERFGISEHEKKIPTELSGGQQQRIGIARAIVNDPQVILADEPVGNLDSNSAKNVLGILEELNEKEKKTVIMVTHNPENLEYADRIIYMKDGVITRQQINKEKHIYKESGLADKLNAPKSPSTELMEMLRTYRGLSPEQINILIMPYKAKIFTHHFITDRSVEETKVFEDVVSRRLMGTLSDAELFDILDRSFSDGGVGYDRRTAAKVVERINDVVRLAKLIYQKDASPEGEVSSAPSDDEKADILVKHILDNFVDNHLSKMLDLEQTMRLRQAIVDRIANRIQKSDFFEILDKPLKSGGTGLNAKMAKNITEEVELILIVGFGTTQVPRPAASTPIQGTDKALGKPVEVMSDLPATAESVTPPIPTGLDLHNLMPDKDKDD